MPRPYKSDIIGARKDIEIVARAWESGVLDHVSGPAALRDIVRSKMLRHKPDSRAPRKSVTTAAKKQQAVELRRRFPQTSQLEIGAAVGLNGGRVSEAIHENKPEPIRGTLL